MDGAAKVRVTYKLQAPGISIEADSMECAEKLFNDYSVHQLKVTTEIEQTKRLLAKEATLKAREEAKKAVEESRQLQLQLELAKIQSKSSETPKSSGLPKPSETEEPSAPPTPLRATSEPSVPETMTPAETSKRRKRVIDYEDVADVTSSESLAASTESS